MHCVVHIREMTKMYIIVSNITAESVTYVFYDPKICNLPRILNGLPNSVHIRARGVQYSNFHIRENSVYVF